MSCAAIRAAAIFFARILRKGRPASRRISGQKTLTPGRADAVVCDADA
jgi:hypothetical protein